MRTIGVPFIALKAPDDRHDFRLAEFMTVNRDLRRLHKNSSVLIGEAREPSALFHFCHHVFSELEHDFSTGLVLHTLRPETIEKAVLSTAPESHDGPFSVWSQLVEAQGTAQEQRAAERESRERPAPD
jgi:hypothetical protein